MNTDILLKDIEEEILSNPFYQNIKNTSFLITGANGMLANYMVRLLTFLAKEKRQNIEIYALVRNSEKAIASFGDYMGESYFHLLVQDVCGKIDAPGSIDYIIHAAGNASPYAIEHNPTDLIKANLLGTINLLDFSREHAVKKILYTSTREVYGDVQNLPDICFLEEDAVGLLDHYDNRSCYPESKKMAEQIFKSYGRQYQVPYVIARIAHVYGPGMNLYNDGRVMSDFISNILSGKNIEMKSAGSAIRAFCYLSDAVNALFRILAMGKYSVYNVANEDEPISVASLANKIVSLGGSSSQKTVYLQNADLSGYCTYTRKGLSTKRLRQLGWSPRICLDEGILRTLKYFRTQKI